MQNILINNSNGLRLFVDDLALECSDYLVSMKILNLFYILICIWNVFVKLKDGCIAYFLYRNQPL